MSSVDPHRPGLSEQLKFLDSAQGQLAPPPFDLDDVVRGGRRRHRRRTALQASGVAAAVIAVVAGVALGPLDRGADGRPGLNEIGGTPTATASATPTLPPIDAGDLDLDYTQTGETVTGKIDGEVVATLTLKPGKWSGSVGTVVLTVNTTRPFIIDPMTFSVDSASSFGENSPTNEDQLTVTEDQREVTLSFTDVERPTGLKWTPQDGKPSDVDGMAAFWDLTAADQD